MFRPIILPIFRGTRLCVTACGIMHPRCCCNTQSSAPEDGQHNCPKHVELTGIINKPLSLLLVGCQYYLYQWCTDKQISNNEIYLLIKYIKSVLWRVVKRLSYKEDARCLKVKYTSRVELHTKDQICSVDIWPYSRQCLHVHRALSQQDVILHQ